MPRECRRLIRRIPKTRRRGASFLLGAHGIRLAADAYKPALMAFRTDLANAQTRDPALLSGRAAWRQAGRHVAAVPPASDVCAELRAWRSAGYPRRTVVRAFREVRIFLDVASREFERKVGAASRRLQALGIPAEEAVRFAEPGNTNDDESGEASALF